MKRVTSSRCLGFLASTLLTTTGALADPSPALQKKIDAVIDQSIAQDRLVGAVVLVAQDGELIYQRAVGFADKESQRPMQLDTLFRLSSVSKPIVTTAAMVLIEQKKLSLDDAVTRWLPTFKPKLADGTTPVITVRQLLTHTAGLAYGFSEKADGPYHAAKVSDGFDDLRMDLTENVRRIGSQPLLNKPGEMWRYSLSIDVLGAVIEKAAGESLDAAVARLVTKPLSMSNTSFWAATADAERLATAYFNTPTGTARMADPQRVPFGAGSLIYSPSRAFDKTAYPSGGAGMIGSAPDLLRLLETIRKGGAPILTPATAASMLSNQVGAVAGLQPGVRFGFGGALVIDPKAARTPQSSGTWNWGGVYGHSWFVDPVRKVTVILLTNTALEGMSGKLPGALRDAVYESIAP
jgi:CubicO group peptidase (beta-lactamase class C family)